MNAQKLYLAVFAVIVLGIVLTAYVKLSSPKVPLEHREQDVPATTTQDVTSAIPPSTSKVFTLDQVTAHNSETSCWTVISGRVYDLTSFVSRHPGGEKNILKICGKDGTSTFGSQHGGDEKPEATLEKFYVGELTQ